MSFAEAITIEMSFRLRGWHLTADQFLSAISEGRPLVGFLRLYNQMGVA